jgi:hypothetical protein
MTQYKGIDENILMKHLEKAYSEDLERKYQNMGYETFTNYRISNDATADFVAKKDSRIIIFEFIKGRIHNDKKNKLMTVKEYVEQHQGNVKLKLIFLNSPHPKTIEFDKLKEIILDNIINQNMPDELDMLSEHTRIEEITEMEIDFIEIKDDEIHVSGKGEVEASFKTNSDSDDDYDEFPFEFKIVLTNEWKIKDAEYEFSSYFV